MQGTILASLLLAMQQKGVDLQVHRHHSLCACIVMFAIPSHLHTHAQLPHTEYHTSCKVPADSAAAWNAKVWRLLWGCDRGVLPSRPIPRGGPASTLPACHRRQGRGEAGESAHPELCCALLQEQRPLKFIVCIGGVVPAPAVAHRLLSPPILMPSLHIIGEKDYIRQVHTTISASAEDVPPKSH